MKKLEIDGDQKLEDGIPPIEAPASVLGEPMDLMTALQLVLRKSLAHDGLIRGLHEAAKAIEKHAVQLCVLAEDCNQPDYVKLVKALCADHNVHLVTVPSAKTLGEWAGLCKIDSEGKARKVIGCSCVVIKDYGEDSEGLHIVQEFSSLMCETIPSHLDYQVLLPKQKAALKKKLLDVMDELEALKPLAQHQADEINKGSMLMKPPAHQNTELDNNSVDLAFGKKQLPSSSLSLQPPLRITSELLQRQAMERNQVKLSENQMNMHFKKLTLNLPYPKEETLSRHSILGPKGLQSQWTGPISGIRVQYPSNVDSTPNDISRLNQEESHDPAIFSNDYLKGKNSVMESVLSLDDGRWPISGEESYSLAPNTTEEEFSHLNIRQPSIPPVLAKVQPEPCSISPSKVADPRPGLPKLSQERDSKTYQKLHVPVQMLECFLKLAEANTTKNLETCGVLAGLLKNCTFVVTTLIIPKQESTSDSCQTTDEEEIFNVQDERSLFPLGWIHTHPTQTCFMSSVDLHTHYSYQIMLPEAIAIVMAPTDTERRHGIFHLSDPSGVSVIRNCEERGFHPHEEPSDGGPLYEHCSHVLMNTNVIFDVVDLR